MLAVGGSHSGFFGALGAEQSGDAVDELLLAADGLQFEEGVLGQHWR